MLSSSQITAGERVCDLKGLTFILRFEQFFSLHIAEVLVIVKYKKGRFLCL